MLRSLAILTLCAALSAATLPAVALAQNAGDDQYADPFGDMPADGDGAAGGGNGDGSAPTDPAQPVAETPATPVAAEDATVQDTSDADPAAASSGQLPRTGLPAGALALTGLALLACGALMHFTLLRVAPDSAYARALRMGPLHTAPRPPGFEALNTRRRFRPRRR